MAIERILIVMAMHAEAKPVVDRLGLAATDSPPWPAWLPMKLYESEELGLSLVQLGRDSRFGVDLIGTQAATLGTTYAVEHLRPDIVISAGTCGGFVARGASIGDVYLSEREFHFHDRRVPLPGFHEASLGAYESADVRGLGQRLSLKTGVITTGDALDASDECRRRMEASEASAKEMEAAAVAWVCSLAGVPLFAVKAVTDLVDGGQPTEAEFIENLSLAVERLVDAIEKIVPEIRGRDLMEFA